MRVGCVFVSPTRGCARATGSDQRKFQSRLLVAFPRLTEETLRWVIGPKDEIKELKAATTPPCVIYTVNDQPSFVLVEGVLFPTVYTLWKLPSLVHSLPTWAPVVDRLRGGADFMLPGVALADQSELGLATLGTWRKNDPGAVRIVDTEYDWALAARVFAGVRMGW